VRDESQANRMTFLYFAYGSNMLTEWLLNRCPSAKPIGIAIAANHKLVFEKRSVDKSGKATLVCSEGVNTPGVVFEIAESERGCLDAAEGFKQDKPNDSARYGRDDNFQIQIVATGSIDAVTTYLANKPEDGLKPYDWYLALVIAGAVQHGLDLDYIDKLRKTKFDKTNDNRQKAICTLQAAGHKNYTDLLLA
jgi:gamma-glutamylcyclotransferase